MARPQIKQGPVLDGDDLAGEAQRPGHDTSEARPLCFGDLFEESKAERHEVRAPN